LWLPRPARRPRREASEMDAVLFLLGVGVVAGGSFTIALIMARLAIRIVFAVAGVRDIR